MSRVHLLELGQQFFLIYSPTREVGTTSEFRCELALFINDFIFLFSFRHSEGDVDGIKYNLLFFSPLHFLYFVPFCFNNFNVPMILVFLNLSNSLFFSWFCHYAILSLIFINHLSRHQMLIWTSAAKYRGKCLL